jgi:hypothetical protein
LPPKRLDVKTSTVTYPIEVMQAQLPVSGSVSE